jgi:hypothetical protein
MPTAASALEQLLKAIEPCIDRAAPERFWQVQPALQAFVDKKVLQGLLNDALAALAADPCHFGDWQPTEWVLGRGRGYVLSVAVFDQPRRYIHALPFFACYAPVDGQALTYTRYALPEGYHNPVFDPGVQLTRVDDGSVSSGEVLALHTNRYAYDFHLPQPVLVLKLATAPILPLEWLFNKDTLQAWQANDADLSSTQLRVAADVLGKFAHQTSLPPLLQLSHHPHHAVRWAAIQSLGRLNRSVALSRLDEACSDAHPHVRHAARRTLGLSGPRAGGSRTLV